MKKYLLILICLITLAISPLPALSIQTKLPQNNIQVTEEEVLNQKTQNLFWEFVTGIIRFFRGDTGTVAVKSKDVKEFSSTIKTYQEIEAKNNPDYENSHAKEKADFGTGLLDIFAGILAFFGL